MINFKAVIVIIFIGLIIYGNSLNNDFTADDIAIIKTNNFITTFHNIPQLFSKKYFNHSGELTYRPLATLSYFLLYFFFGKIPFGYHLSSVLLNILNAIFVFYIGLLLFENRKISLFAALLFVTHPVHTEAILGVSFNEDLLSTLFILISMYTYIHITGKNVKKGDTNEKNISKKIIFIGSLILIYVSYLFALFSKESAIVLPGLIVLYDFFFIQKERKTEEIIRRFKSYYIGFIIVTFVFIIIRFGIMSTKIIGASFTYLGGNLYSNILTMLKVIVKYLQLLLVPFNLSLDYYSFPVSHSILDISVIFSIAILFTVFCYFLFLLKKKDFLNSYAIVFFFIAILPVSNIIPTGAVMAERYLYLPSIGFCLFLAANIKHFSSYNFSLPKRLSILFQILIIVYYSFATINRNLDWKDDLTLWSRTIQTSPKSTYARCRLGNIYLEKGLDDKAIIEYQQALEINNDSIEAHYDLGVVYAKKLEYDMAIEQFEQAIKINPNYAKAYQNVGLIFYKLGDYKKTIESYRTAIEIMPYNPETYFNLGVLYEKIGLYGMALSTYEQALRINPDFINAYFNIAKIYDNKKQYDKAIEYFKKAIAINQNLVPLHFNLALTYEKAGLYPNAAVEYKQIFTINPGIARAREDYKRVLEKSNKFLKKQTSVR